MPVATDVLRAHVAPRQTARRVLRRIDSEGKAFALAFAGCLMLLIAQFPELVRTGGAGGANPTLTALAAGRVIGGLVLAPLLFYALAGLTCASLRILRFPISWMRSRVSLFWALLAVSPAAMLAGLARGFAGQHPATTAVPLAVLLLFLVFWVSGLLEAAAADRKHFGDTGIIAQGWGRMRIFCPCLPDASSVTIYPSRAIVGRSHAP